MLTSTRALGASLLCLAGAVAQTPALAAQWRIVDATIDQISLGQGASDSPFLHAELPNAGAPFQDGSYQQPPDQPWMPYQYAAWGVASPPQPSFWSEWRLFFLPNRGAAPSIDLANMQAHFGGMELTVAYGVYDGKSGWYVDDQPVTALGLSEGVAITQVGEGRYTANWSVRSGGPSNQGDPRYPLYSVNLTFVAFPEGTPWSYAPVPEPSSVFLALAGVGAVGWARRRQIRRIGAV